MQIIVKYANLQWYTDYTVDVFLLYIYIKPTILNITGLVNDLHIIRVAKRNLNEITFVLLAIAFFQVSLLFTVIKWILSNFQAKQLSKYVGTAKWHKDRTILKQVQHSWVHS